MERRRFWQSPGDNPWTFFALVFMICWSCWLPGLFLAQSGAAPFVPFQALGVIAGLVLPTLFFTRIAGGREGWRDFWRRVLDFRRISGRWYAVILLFFPLISLLALAAERLTGSATPAFEPALKMLAHPGQLAALVVFTLFFGPFPEELCWRGFALDRLQARHSPLKASLLLGLVWSLWHVPLFFIPGTFQYEIIGVGTPAFWLFFASLAAETILMSWIYSHTGRSILSAILFHFMSNFTGEFFELSGPARVFRGLLTVGVAAVVAAGMITETRKKEGARSVSAGI